MQIKQAMILAAGMGSRMKELTQEIPKPMIMVLGKSLIERQLEYLYKNNVQKVVINCFYKGETLDNFVKSLDIYRQLEIIFSYESELLGTAGGIKNALHHFEEKAFFVLNSDSLFEDFDQNNPSLKQLSNLWDPKKMKLLLLLLEKQKSFGYWGNGDFNLNNEGQIFIDSKNNSLVNIGLSITDKRLFADYNDGKLEFFPNIYNNLILEKQIYGKIYDGKWFHIGDMKAYNLYHKNNE